MTDKNPDKQPQTTVLYDEHDVHVATFTDFGGYLMPLRYSSELEEHRAVREQAGLFDVSHMGKLRIAGPQAASLIDYAFTGNIASLQINAVRYGLILNHDGGILDDVLCYRLDDEEFMLIPNAGNQEKVFDHLQTLQHEHGFGQATVRNEAKQYSILAIQGPDAAAIVEQIVSGVLNRQTDSEADSQLDSPPAEQRISSVILPSRFRLTQILADGQAYIISRIGYTGEDGFELMIPVAQTVQVWQGLMEFVQSRQLHLAGLAARDTLRLEAGFLLYGNDISEDVTPLESGLSWAVDFNKGHFCGKDALLANTKRYELVALTGEGKRAARAGYEVFADQSAEGLPLGKITSGALSPTLGYPIAFARIDAEQTLPTIGEQVFINIRGKMMAMTVTEPPFITS